MRRFQGEWVGNIMDRLRLPEDQPIEAKMVSKSIERAQRQVESQNFEIRKNVLKYDEVMNRQREVVYDWRQSILEGTAGEDLIDEWIESALEQVVEDAIGGGTSRSDWDLEALELELNQFFPIEMSKSTVEGKSVEEIVDHVVDLGAAAFAAREEDLGADTMVRVEKSVMLSVIDNKWREQLSEMDYLRAGIGLRAMGQRDPLTEYQREAYEMFTDLVESVKRDAIKYLFHVELAKPKSQPQRVEANPTGKGPVKQATSDKVGRNDPCPCGSGKKYKRCHGAA
jgi:preprotein translocase subunit SecA